MQTPQRMVTAFDTTTDFIVKSRPVVSLAEWHSTQYLAKKACAQLSHVSPALPSPALESAAAPSDEVGPTGVEEPEEQAVVAPRATRRTARHAMLRTIAHSVSVNASHVPASIVLLVAFVCLYLRSIDVHATNALWHNFVFDADIDRILQDAQRGQNDVVFARHPLFALTIALPASALARLGVSPIASLRAVAALAGGLGVAGARVLFLRITGDRVAAVLFASLYGLAATVWLLSSIPETFPLSAAAIVGLFLVHDPASVRPRRHPARFATFAVLSALAVGVTVANAIYVALVASCRRVCTGRASCRPRW